MAKCKTHLAANGFTQVESIDLNETFSHVARMESIQAVPVVVAIGVDVMLSGLLLVDKNPQKSFFWCQITTNGGLWVN
jgi:hypothetical protein